MTRIAVDAGALALGFYGQVDVSLKDDQSVITEADPAVEEFLKEALQKLMPEAHFIGEESVRDDSALTQARAAEWVWVVDPIDGTATFVEGLDTFGVSVGLFREGKPYAGVLVYPALGHSYTAIRGGGARYDGQLIRVLTEEPALDRASICVSRNAHRYMENRYPGKVHCFGTTSLHVALVARGAAIGAIARSHIWDFAAGAAILLEAGGVIRTFDGTEIDWRDIMDGRKIWPPLLASTPTLWDRVTSNVTMLGDF
jgi:myo-inositol-1(or 4)-monophosphatase